MVDGATPRLALAALLLGLSASCGRGAPATSVLLVSIDTLRADRLGCYGYERDTTPNLDRLAAEGVLFERSYSHAPFTAPSHASLLTSLHTQSHGVHAWEEVLSPEAVPMGERFAAAGYRTAAFYNHPGLKRSEVWRGFEEVELRYFEEAERTVEAYLAWLDEAEGPTATWMHLWDVHRPYGFRSWEPEWLRPHVEREKLVLSCGEGRFGEPHDLRVGRHEGFYNLSPERLGRDVALGAERRILDANDLAHLRDRYDGGVWYADRGMGLLLDALRERGLLDRMVVAVTADHGESLTEREACFFTHDPFLYEETLRVPLILRLPRAEYAGSRLDLLARGVDVLPTLLEISGLAGHRGDQGRSLMPAIRGETVRPAPIFAETRTKNAKLRSERVQGPGNWLEHRLAVGDGKRKLIHDLEADSWHFYDLEGDPGETHDLIDDPIRKEEIERLRKIFFILSNGLPDAGDTTAELDEEMSSLLEDIGY